MMASLRRYAPPLPIPLTQNHLAKNVKMDQKGLKLVGFFLSNIPVLTEKSAMKYSLNLPELKLIEHLSVLFLIINVMK